MPPKKKDEKRETEEGGREEVGVFYFADGAKYDGQFSSKDGGAVKRHGFGMFYDVGTVFDGQWVDDEMHGEGTVTFDTGASYAGSFYHNAFNGRGKYTWPDGSYYEGQFRANKLHGEGTFVDNLGRRWVGKFYDGIGKNLQQEVA